jgi:membrane-associated phospholipid phosphatase
MALLNIWGFRRTGVIGWAAAVLNILMVCATPWFGGHYLVDVLAGAATALFALAVVRGAPILWAKYFSSPGPAIRKNMVAAAE